MTHHAHGEFTVSVQPLSPSPAEGIARYSIDKQFHGDMEASSKGEMFSAGDPRQGQAGYVAIEAVTGMLSGKRGSFVLQHSATMDASGQKMTIAIVPGSGTGEFKGISGSLEIIIEGGRHSYSLAYTLP